METSPITRSLNLSPTTVAVTNAIAAEEVQSSTLESTKVTAPPAPGDSAPHGGTSGQPGLGGHLDLYDTEVAKAAAEKNAQSVSQPKATPDLPKTSAEIPVKKQNLLGKDDKHGLIHTAPPEPEFPFLIPLTKKAPDQPPGQAFDATI